MPGQIEFWFKSADAYMLSGHRQWRLLKGNAVLSRIWLHSKNQPEAIWHQGAGCSPVCTLDKTIPKINPFADTLTPFKYRVPSSPLSPLPVLHCIFKSKNKQSKEEFEERKNAQPHPFLPKTEKSAIFIDQGQIHFQFSFVQKLWRGTTFNVWPAQIGQICLISKFSAAPKISKIAQISKFSDQQICSPSGPAIWNIVIALKCSVLLGRDQHILRPLRARQMVFEAQK